jgi:hypothetical protein
MLFFPQQLRDRVSKVCLENSEIRTFRQYKGRYRSAEHHVSEKDWRFSLATVMQKYRLSRSCSHQLHLRGYEQVVHHLGFDEPG